MRISLLVACLAIGGTIAGRLRRSKGGHPIPIERAPHFVSIRMNSLHLCGGSLITDRLVLTAAHCLVDDYHDQYANLTVISGTDQRASGGTRHEIALVFCHKRYETEDLGEWKNDIGLVFLTKPVILNAKQNIIRLPKAPLTYFVKGTFTAFETTWSRKAESTLHTAQTEIIPVWMCGLDDPSYTEDKREPIFCGTHTDGLKIKASDSGGPLAYDGQLVGISSWTLEKRYKTDFYTNVYRYLRFINKIKRFVIRNDDSP